VVPDPSEWVNIALKNHAIVARFIQPIRACLEELGQTLGAGSSPKLLV
jgi:hypothetical protein